MILLISKPKQENKQAMTLKINENDEVDISEYEIWVNGIEL